MSDAPLELAYRHCQRLTRRSRSNFRFAFYSLPKQMYREMCVLYAFMHLTDDLGDNETIPVDVRRTKLKQWRNDLQRSFSAETAVTPVLRAMADVAQRNEIPISLLEDVINGVESDLTPREFETFDELNQYCYQVAGAVGLCCLKIWGQNPESSVDIHQMAIDCGTAFQLTNILRDISEDAGRGRVYLPTEDLQQFQLTQEDLLGANDANLLCGLIQFEAERAWSYYRSAVPLLENVSPEGRHILSGFFQAYSLLLKRIELKNYDVISHRVRLSRFEKLSIFLRAVLKTPRRIQIPNDD